MENQKRFSTTYLNMLRSLITFMFDAINLPITSSVLPFKDGATILKGNLVTIDDFRHQAKAVIKGFAAQKKSLRKATTSSSYSIMKSVFAYGINTNNQNIIQAMKVTKKQLNRMKVADFINFIQASINTVTPLVSSLTAYNVTQTTVDDWQALLTQLINVDSLPNTAINHRKMLNTQAANLLNQSITYLSNVMDPLSLNFTQSAPAYYMEYRNNRRLKGISSHTKFRVHITNELNEPQVNVPVTQNNTSNTALTNIDGDATVNVKVTDHQQPIYYFTIGAGANSIQSGPIEIKLGHTVSRSYIIQPSGFIIPAPVDENSNVPA